MRHAAGTSLQLKNGSHVAVIGGGPAGSFFALHLLRYTRQVGLKIHVTIFEARDFSRAGPPGCGRCAGLLSAGLQAGLRQLGLNLPAEVIQSRADSYILHLADGAMEIFPPTGRPIISVYRSRGPRLHPLPREVNFDEWLLHHAEQTGASIIYRTVKKILLTPIPSIETRQKRYTFDLVALAAGVNGRCIQIDGCNYRPQKPKQWCRMSWPYCPAVAGECRSFLGRGLILPLAPPFPKATWSTSTCWARG